MSQLGTWALHIHSPSIFAVLYSIGPRIHMPGECMGREQSCIGIIIQLMVVFHFPSFPQPV